jgi:hypothetical protein
MGLERYLTVLGEENSMFILAAEVLFEYRTECHAGALFGLAFLCGLAYTLGAGLGGFL